MVNLRSQDFNDLEWAKKEVRILLSLCISGKDRERLKDKWNKSGGYHVIPWYEWVLQNVSVSVDLPKENL